MYSKEILGKQEFLSPMKLHGCVYSKEILGKQEFLSPMKLHHLLKRVLLLHCTLSVFPKV